MKTTVSMYDFEREFVDAGRTGNFTYGGKRALFDYLEEYEESTGEELELDVISLCCDFTEYEDIEEYNRNYEPVESIEEVEELTTVIRIDGEEGFIIQDY